LGVGAGRAIRLDERGIEPRHHLPATGTLSEPLRAQGVTAHRALRVERQLGPDVSHGETTVDALRVATMIVDELTARRDEGVLVLMRPEAMLGLGAVAVQIATA